MAALRLGVPLIVTRGHLTEKFWNETPAVRIHDVQRFGDMAAEVRDLLRDDEARARLVSTGQELYARTFDVNLTVAALTRPRAGKAA